ncbi:hypothetical protein MTO96_028395 [Rhipicephalus appendiculatus]
MITHAYVRYQDGKHLAIVPVEYIKNFNPNEDFSTTFYMVKWTDSTGTCDYYRARILQVDIGQGLRIPLETWRRVQAPDKDSLFIKDLLVTIWDPAQLQGRSLQGKHCPRFPDRPRKEQLTPWKVSVMRACYKRRLEKQGFPECVVQTLMKRMNDYVGEKIADIDKMAKSCTLATCQAAPCLDDSHQQGPARCAIYVKRELLQAEVPAADLVGGPFECRAVRIRLEGGGDTTVASVYIQPQQPWDPKCLRQLAHRLGREFLLCGDVNAHHPAWGGHRTDPRGREVRDVLQQLGLVILNTEADTFVRHGRQATSTAIDLSVVTEGCRYSWSPLPDTWGSDHLPILLSPLPRQGPPGPRVPLGRLADLPAAVPAGHWREGPPATDG